MRARSDHLKLVFLCSLVIALSACVLPGVISATEDPNANSTQVAQTVDTRLTEISIADIPADTSTPTPEIPTATNTPAPTSTPEPTKTKAPTATATPLPCLAAELVKHLTAPSGVKFPGNSKFVKVWQIRNVGSCTWTKAFQVVYDSGNQMGGDPITLPKKVVPGDTVEISIEMKAPGPKGRYESYWIFKTDQGKKFGVGANFDQPFAVKITVPGIKPAKPFDFAHEFCNAIWKDKAGRLLCNGNPAAYKNAVGYTTTVKMENGKEDNEPALLININTGDRVEASYPTVDIQAGDRFISRIGCVNGNLTCKVQIILSYEVVGTGQQVVLTKYIEDYDKKSEVLEFDLSSLAGKKVVFDLEIIAKSDSGINQIFWMAPSILNP